MDLRGKVTIITGGGRGIGRALSLMMASEGALVIICGRDKGELVELQNLINESGGNCDYAVVDVTRLEQVREFVSGVEQQHGPVDVLVNNAGYCAPPAPVEELGDEDYRRILATNIDGVFYFTRLVVPMMKKKNEGVIVTISSGCGRRGAAGLAAYSASKFAVQGFMQAVAAELRTTAIRCVLINPGGVATRMLANLFGEAEASRQQPPEVIADVLRTVLKEKIVVPSGGGICVRGGEVTEVYGPGE